MLVDGMKDILKVWWRSDMIKLRKLFPGVGVGGLVLAGGDPNLGELGVIQIQVNLE